MSAIGADGRFRGLPDAQRAFERSRNRDAYEALPVYLRLFLRPYDTARFPELLDAEFGMQDGKGVLLAGELQPDGRFLFEVAVVARRHRKSGALMFLGPYAHGTAGDQFLYLNWRVRGVTTNNWIWRRKVSLRSLDWRRIQESEAAGRAFEFDATGRTGHDRTPFQWTASII